MRICDQRKPALPIASKGPPCQKVAKLMKKDNNANQKDESNDRIGKNGFEHRSDYLNTSNFCGTTLLEPATCSGVIPNLRSRRA